MVGMDRQGWCHSEWLESGDPRRAVDQGAQRRPTTQGADRQDDGTVSLALVDEPPPRGSRARKATHRLVEVLDYEFVECRAMGHSWRHHKKSIGVDDTHDGYPRPFASGTGMVGRISNCAQCRGTRVKWITRSGEVINRYYMPEGYSRVGEEYKPTQREWRSTYVASVFKDFSR